MKNIFNSKGSTAADTFIYLLALGAMIAIGVQTCSYLQDKRLFDGVIDHIERHQNPPPQSNFSFGQSTALLPYEPEMQNPPTMELF